MLVVDVVLVVEVVLVVDVVLVVEVEVVVVLGEAVVLVVAGDPLCEATTLVGGLAAAGDDAAGWHCVGTSTMVSARKPLPPTRRRRRHQGVLTWR